MVTGYCGRRIKPGIGDFGSELYIEVAMNFTVSTVLHLVAETTLIRGTRPHRSGLCIHYFGHFCCGFPRRFGLYDAPCRYALQDRIPTIIYDAIARVALVYSLFRGPVFGIIISISTFIVNLKSSA